MTRAPHTSDPTDPPHISTSFQVSRPPSPPETLSETRFRTVGPESDGLGHSTHRFRYIPLIGDLRPLPILGLGATTTDYLWTPHLMGMGASHVLECDRRVGTYHPGSTMGNCLLIIRRLLTY